MKTLNARHILFLSVLALVLVFSFTAPAAFAASR